MTRKTTNYKITSHEFLDFVFCDIDLAFYRVNLVFEKVSYEA